MTVSRPTIDDLILTKQVASRPKDLEDIRPVDGPERQEILALVEWFTRRYPTGADRLAYVRRAYLRWQSARSLFSPPDVP